MRWVEKTGGNPVMTFPIKKRINTELFIDRMAALYKGETLIRVGTNAGDQLVVLVDWRIVYTLP